MKCNTVKLFETLDSGLNVFYSLNLTGLFRCMVKYFQSSDLCSFYWFFLDYLKDFVFSSNAFILKKLCYESNTISFKSYIIKNATYVLFSHKYLPRTTMNVMTSTLYSWKDKRFLRKYLKSKKYNVTNSLIKMY